MPWSESNTFATACYGENWLWESKKIGHRNLTLLPCGVSCCLEVEISSSPFLIKTLAYIAFNTYIEIGPKPQLLLLDKYNSTCSYMCLHPAFVANIGKGERNWAEGLAACKLFLVMNSCRAACASPLRIRRVQRLVPGKLMKTRSLRRQLSKWCLGHLDAGSIGVWREEDLCGLPALGKGFWSGEEWHFICGSGPCYTLLCKHETKKHTL